ncbi:hypothetical protein E2986_14112 [Frieseomelitta varia]|uniref:Uncharacterized protein n=1 Tax=Frieseomelitta varia TaxID=561572 RepID=A0A833RCJ3_9HYME|nr:hypothetical protein E2986_14112 [Frieseomelitta varia]
MLLRLNGGKSSGSGNEGEGAYAKFEVGHTGRKYETTLRRSSLINNRFAMVVLENKSSGAGSSVWDSAATKTYGGVWYIAKSLDACRYYIAGNEKRIPLFVRQCFLVFYLQWMQFSQHSEAIPFYHGHSNPIGRAVEIPHISIYMSSLHSTCIQVRDDYTGLYFNDSKTRQRYAAINMQAGSDKLESICQTDRNAMASEKFPASYDHDNVSQRVQFSRSNIDFYEGSFLRSALVEGRKRTCLLVFQVTLLEIETRLEHKLFDIIVVFVHLFVIPVQAYRIIEFFCEHDKKCIFNHCFDNNAYRNYDPTNFVENKISLMQSVASGALRATSRLDPIPIDGQWKAPGASLANPVYNGMRRCDPTRNGSILSVTYDTEQKDECRCQVHRDTLATHQHSAYTYALTLQRFTTTSTPRRPTVENVILEKRMDTTRRREVGVGAIQSRREGEAESQEDDDDGDDEIQDGWWWGRRSRANVGRHEGQEEEESDAIPRDWLRERKKIKNPPPPLFLVIFVIASTKISTQTGRIIAKNNSAEGKRVSRMGRSGFGPVGRADSRGGEEKKERAKGLVAHQHSKYSGQKEGAGLFGTEEEQKPPREEDVALIFIREKRGCRVPIEHLVFMHYCQTIYVKFKETESRGKRDKDIRHEIPRWRSSTIFNGKEQANDRPRHQYAHQNGFRLPSRLLYALNLAEAIRKTSRTLELEF